MGGWRNGREIEICAYVLSKEHNPPLPSHSITTLDFSLDGRIGDHRGCIVSFRGRSNRLLRRCFFGL